MSEERAYKYDVFVSYSHDDEDWVEKTLLPRLEGAGLRVCIDFRDFVPGKAALLNMQDAARDSRHTVLVLTQSWVDSEWALYEGVLARSSDPAGLQRRTVPLLLHRCELPEFVSALTYVDFTRPGREAVAWQQLLLGLGWEGAPGEGEPGTGDCGGGGEDRGEEIRGRETGGEEEGPPPTVPTIDPDDPPIRLIRKLLTDAFAADTLRRFCEEHSDLRHVVHYFGPGHSFADMIDQVIEYCRMYLLWEELLQGVAEENPRQFKRFVSQLHADQT
jgi:hypothetical protein